MRRAYKKLRNSFRSSKAPMKAKKEEPKIKLGVQPGIIKLEERKAKLPTEDQLRTGDYGQTKTPKVSAYKKLRKKFR